MNNQINPLQIVELGVVKVCPFSQVQQVGIDLTVSEEVFLKKGDCYNVLLNETIELPSGMYATLQQRSSYSRKGVFITSGVYDPGYCGSLGCTIYNFGEDLTIPKDTRILQILVFRADSASDYNGQFQNQ